MGQSRILLIEDNQIDAEFIGSHLRLKDFSICVAEDVKGAFTLLIHELPDLILLDSSNGEGVDFCRLVRGFSDLPIIILSENPQKLEELKCLESGADDFVVKPFSVEILVLKVRAVMRRKKDQRASLFPSGQSATLNNV